MSEYHDDIVAMARAASYDDRLADGMLYRKLADEIERLRAALVESEAQTAKNKRRWIDASERATALLNGADYWKAEHLAGNAEIERVQQLLARANADHDRACEALAVAATALAVAERDRDAEAENARLAQDRVQRLTEGNLRLIRLLREITSSYQVWSVLKDSQRARLDAALGGRE